MEKIKKEKEKKNKWTIYLVELHRDFIIYTMFILRLNIVFYRFTYQLKQNIY